MGTECTDAPKKLFFYELCRLCLENAGVRNVCDTIDLVDDIFICTGVKVTPADDLPHKICNKCSDIVKSCKELRILASKNDAHLQTLFGDGKDDCLSDADTVKLSEYTQVGDENASQSELGPEESVNFNGLNSSKQKLCMLLQEGEKCNKADPVSKPSIYLRKDLFSSSPQKTSPTRTESPKKIDNPHKLLKVKVEQENQRKRFFKTDDSDGETSFRCEECDKSFDTYKKLYLHRRLHNKKICCPLDACGKKFATKGDLEKHVRTHTGERPFQCTLCDKSFAQRVSLKQHIANVHSTESGS